MYQEGLLALYPAIAEYDPAAENKFLTYAGYHIRQRMQRYLQTNGSCLRLPVHCLEKVRQYQRFCSQYQAEYGHEPSDRTAAANFGFSLEHRAAMRTVKRFVWCPRLWPPAIGKGLLGGLSLAAIGYLLGWPMAAFPPSVKILAEF